MNNMFQHSLTLGGGQLVKTNTAKASSSNGTSLGADLGNGRQIVQVVVKTIEFSQQVRSQCNGSLDVGSGTQLLELVVHSSEALTAAARVSLAWSLLGLGDIPSCQSTMESLNDGQSVSTLRSMSKTKKVILQLHGVNHRNVVALQEALLMADKVLDVLPGSARIQVHKINILVSLGLWDEVQSSLEDISRKTWTMRDIFAGDLAPKNPFRPDDNNGQPDAPIFVIRNLLDARLAKTCIRSLLFGEQIAAVNNLLVEEDGSKLPVTVQNEWRRWMVKETTQAAQLDMLFDMAGDDSLATATIDIALKKCKAIELAPIFPNDRSTTIQGKLLADWQAFKCVLLCKELTENAHNMRAGMCNDMNDLAKGFLRPCGCVDGGKLDIEKPFPHQLATPNIVKVLLARAPVNMRSGFFLKAAKDCAFLFELAAQGQHGLQRHLQHFQLQLECALGRCTHAEILGLKSLVESEDALTSMVKFRKRKFHSDKNDNCSWCNFCCHRLDAVSWGSLDRRFKPGHRSC